MAALRIIAVLNVVMGIITIAFGEYILLAIAFLPLSCNKKMIKKKKNIKEVLKEINSSQRDRESFKTSRALLFRYSLVLGILPQPSCRVLEEDGMAKCRYPVDGLINLT